jgi:hypothetical protein
MTITRPLPASTTVTETTDHATNLSRVRSRIGDGGGLDGAGKVYLTDERINDALVQRPTVLGASILCVEMILADIARDTDFSAGTISTQRTQVTAQFEGVLKRLREEEARSAGGIFVGGTSFAQARAIASNPDIKPRVFRVGMDTKW